MIDCLSKIIETKKEFIEVGFFYENCHKLFNLRLIANNKGFKKRIYERDIHRPGLALSGYVELFSYSRIQVFGNTEIKYLKSLSKKNKLKSIQRFFSFDIPCLIFTNGNKPDEVILSYAKKTRTSIFLTDASTTKLVYEISDFLDDQFSLRTTVHGSFADVYGVGLLFVGKSGIGKSEVILDLVERGHRLVADDIIVISKKGEGILIGAATNISKHFMEIRGVGIINVQKMFGVRSIRYQKRIEVIIVLEEFDKNKEYTRTGLDTLSTKILNVDLPTVLLPIIPGKNITVIAEVIALNYLLNHYGYKAAMEMQNRTEIAKAFSRKNRQKQDFRAINYFEHDTE